MLAGMGMVTAYLIWRGRKATPPEQLNLAIMIAGFTLSLEIIETLLLILEGHYDVLIDLPLYLCDLAAITLPFVLYRQNRKWIGILYFWAMAGTFQALITPDVEQGFPSFTFFRYFLMHGGIVAAILFTVIVFRIRITWRDFFLAILYAQVYLLGIHLLNQFLGSNYSYTVQKPPGPTVLDYMGAWPWYIFWGEILMIVLFLLLMIPFVWKRPAASDSETTSFGQV